MSEHHRFVRTAPLASQSREAADTREDPGVIEHLLAGARVEADRVEDIQELRRARAYEPLIDALTERGVAREKLIRSPKLFGVDLGGGVYDYESIWREAQRAGIEGLPGKREEFEQNAFRRNGGRDRDLDTMARGSGAGAVAAQFIGAMGGSLADPINLYSLPFGGGGKTVAARLISEGLVNAGVEAAQAADGSRLYGRLGEEYGIGQAAADVGLAFAAGAAIRGGIEAAPKIDAAAFDLAKPIREAIDGKFADRDIARAFSEAVPEHLRTAEQEAALHVLTRAVDVEEASPFVRTYRADDLHAAKLTDAMEALEASRIADTAPSRTPAVREGAAASSQSSPVSRPAGGMFDMARYLSRNRAAESSGNDIAAAETSSAFGRYQFLRDTWVEFYRKTFGDTGEDRAAILRKRADGAVQDRVMETFTRANMRALDRAGVPVTDGSAYLAHFLGTRDAIAVLRSAPDTPIGQVVRGASIDANPAVFRDIRTAGDLAAWAGRKMGDDSAPMPSRADGDADDAARAAALDAEEAALNVEAAALPDVDIDRVPELDRKLFESDTSWRIAQTEFTARESGVDPVDDPLYRIRQVVVDREAGRSLNRTAELADELGMSEADLRSGLQRLVATGELRQNAKGQFARLPKSTGRREDVLLFVARRGGVAYDGLGEGARNGGSRGHDLKNTGSLDTFVPGGGPLLRPTGRSLDDIGEALHEEGFFGPPDVTPRPDESAVIALLDRAAGGERIYADGPAPARTEQQDREGVPKGFESRDHFEDEFARYNQAAQHVLGRNLTEAEMIEIGDTPLQLLPDADVPITDELWESGDLLIPRIMAWVNRQLDEALEDAFYEVEDETYAIIADQFAEAAGRQGGEGGAGRGGSAAVERDAGEGGEGGRAGPGDDGPPQLTDQERDAAQAAGAFGPPEIDEATARAFDSDAGDGVQQIAESDWHDIRAQQTDPEIARRQRQEAQLRAEAPMRGESKTGEAQDGTMGLGLFDAADQPKFDLEDGKGPRTAAEIDEEIQADRKALEEIRKCLK